LRYSVPTFRRNGHTAATDSPAIRVLLEEAAFISETIVIMMRTFQNIEMREAINGTKRLRFMDEGVLPGCGVVRRAYGANGWLTFLRQLRSSHDPTPIAVHVIMLTGASDEDGTGRSDAGGFQQSGQAGFGGATRRAPDSGIAEWAGAGVISPVAPKVLRRR
jgi:hypothetical protein